ncbi:hypothetical protein Tco_1383868 [Tanacetum coccineum]
MVISSPCLTDIKNWLVQSKRLLLASPKQTALGKDISNPLIVDSLLKTIWLSMHHVIAMKHWLFQSKRLLIYSMAGEDEFHDDNPPPPPPPVTPTQQAPHTLSTIKLPILKKGEYDIWAMKMEHYLGHTDYPIWEVIQKGNGPVQVSTDTNGQIRVLPPKTAEEILARERERKARTTLLMSIPEDHLAKFHKMTDAKEMWEAIKSRFGGNDESKKMQKYILKQQFEGFSVSNSEGLHKGYDRTKPGVDSLSFDDLYNNLRVFESDVKGSTASSSSNQNVAFVSENTSSTNEVSTAYGVSNSSSHNSQSEHPSSYDEQREQLSDAKKIRFMKIDLDDKTDVLTYHKKLLAEAEKEKEELKAKVEKWHNSSKSLNILLNSQMSARDKAGLGYGDQMNKGVLSFENEVFGSLFDSRSSDIEDSHVNNRYAEGMHAVPPPMTGIYIPSGPDKEIDDSQFTYGPKQSKPSESDARSSDFTSCESNSSEETHESMPESVVNEPKVVSQPKVWTDAPIIEEYESDSDDEHVSLPSKEQETPSFANTIKHVKTPRQTVKQQNTCSKSPKPDKKDCSGLMSKKLGLGYGFTKKASFVCGSFSHLIRDCDFYEKRIDKQAEVNKRKLLTRTGKIQVNTARASSTNNVNTVRASSTKDVSIARHNFNSQAVPTNAVRKVNTVKPIVNNVRPKTVFHKTYSPIRRPFNRTTTSRKKNSNQKVNTAEVKSVSAVGGKWKTVVKPSAGCNWRPKRNYWNKVSKYNGGSNSRNSDIVATYSYRGHNMFPAAEMPWASC